MEILIALVAVAIVAYVLNLLTKVWAALMTAAGGVLSLPLHGQAVIDRHNFPGRGSPKWWEFLALLDGWGGIFKAVATLGASVVIVGAFRSWQIPSWVWTTTVIVFAAASLFYVLAGIGKGLAQWQNQQIARITGITQDHVSRLDRLQPGDRQEIEARISAFDASLTDLTESERYRRVVLEMERLLDLHEAGGGAVQSEGRTPSA